jgi:circadian clock protein KaiB
MSGDRPKGPYRLRLYVAGPGEYTERARKALAEAAVAAGFEYELEIVDLRAEPERASADRVFATPALVKLAPPPPAIVRGDLSRPEEVLAALGVNPGRPEGAREH